MSFFGNINNVTTASANAISTTAETVSTLANAGKESASVLVIKAKSMKEEAVIEAKTNRLSRLSEFAELKNKAKEVEGLENLDKEFAQMMAEYN